MVKQVSSACRLIGFVVTLMLLSPGVYAQQQSKCSYSKLMKEGRALLAGSNPGYASALNKFNAARTCDPSKSNEVDREILRVFKMIEGERDRAVSSERKAREAAIKLQEALKVVETERNRAQEAEKMARNNLEKLQTALSDVVQGILREANNRILHLDYRDAFEKLKNAPKYEPLNDSVALLLLEVAYFRHHSGNVAGAKDPFDRAAALFGKDSLDRSKTFETECARLDSAHAAFLKLRYFPAPQLLPGGLFQMGRDTLLDNEGKPTELPPHQTRVQAFRLAQAETTFWQWNLYVAAKKREIQRYSPEWGLFGDNPAVNLDWVDACEYANWLSEKEGEKPFYRIDSIGSPADWQIHLLPDGTGYRLPTEAEWEYAARAGSATPYLRYAGSNIIDSVGWFSGNNLIRGIPRTHAVMEKMPVVFSNGTALYDMTGNVWEWCWDAFQEDYYQQFHESIAENPSGPETWNMERVMRGGSWYHQPKHSSVSYRWKYSAVKWSGVIGCRMARNY